MNYYGHVVRPAIRTYRRKHIDPVAGQVRADSNRWGKTPTSPNPNIKTSVLLRGTGLERYMVDLRGLFYELLWARGAPRHSNLP